MPTNNLPEKKKKKKIVYLSFTKTLLLLTISILLTLSGIFFSGNSFGAIFFGLCTLVFAYPLYNPNIKVIWLGTKKYKESIAEEFTEKKNESGIFEYTHDGFIISIRDKKNRYNWDDIESMVAFKRDNYTTDCICLDIFCHDMFYSINEDTQGWYRFLVKIKERFPEINKFWDIEIASPAFEKKLTLVFDKEGRTLEEVMKVQYPQKEI